MDFSLSDEQVMIRDGCVRFVKEHYSLDQWTKIAAAGGWSRENWKLLAELGYLTIAQPERHGGTGGPVELALVCQEFGRGLVLEPYIASAVFAARLIAQGGTEAQQARLLTAIMQGEMIISVAHTEPGMRGTGRVAATARRDGNNFILNGEKTLVLAAPADLLLVSAAIEGALDRFAFFLVDPKQAGVAVAPVPLLDHSWCADITLDGVTLPAEALLGDGTGAEAAFAEAQLYAQLAVCAEMIGVMERPIEIAREYLKTRKQFGVVLASFQALRHRVADMGIELEMAKGGLLVLLASFQDPENHPPAATAAMIKAYLGEAGRRVCGQAIQLHGAMGMTKEYGVGRYFARANVINALFGGSDVQMQHYTDSLVHSIKEGSYASV